MRLTSVAAVAVLSALVAAGCASDARRVRAGAATAPPASEAAAPAPAPYAPPTVRAAAPAAPVASAPTPGGAIPFDATTVPLDQALAAGRAAGKPVAVYLLASWCGYCRKLEATTLTDGRVQAEMRGFYNVRMDPNSPAGQPVAREHAKYGYPTVVVFAPSGAVKTTIIGYERPESMVAKLRAAR